MSITVLVPATSARLTTVAAVLLRVPTAGTALVDTLIDGASAAIAAATHRTWGLQTVEELLVGTGTRYLGLSQTPLGAVGTVTEDDVVVTDWTVDDALAGRLYRTDGLWALGSGGGWDSSAYSSGYILPSGAGHPDWATLRYRATYTAGYVLPGTAGTATLPADVQLAATETVAAWAQQAGRDPALQQVQVGDVQERYAVTTPAPGALPPLAQQLLRPWIVAPFLRGR